MGRQALLLILLVLSVASCHKKSSGGSGGGVLPQQRTMDYSGKWGFYHDYTRVCPAFFGQPNPSSGTTTTASYSPQHEGFHYMGDVIVDPVTGDWSLTLNGEHNIAGHTDLKTGDITYTSNDQICGHGRGSGRCVTDQYCEGTFSEPENTPYGGTFQMWR